MERSLDEIAVSGLNSKTDSNQSSWKKFKTKVKISLWDAAANQSAQAVTHETKKRLKAPEVGFRPIQFPKSSAPEHLSDLEWARYKVNQNTRGVVLKTNESFTAVDEKGRRGVAIPAKITIPVDEYQPTLAVQHKIAELFQKRMALSTLNLGPMPADPTEYMRLQEEHLKGRVPNPHPGSILSEYLKGNDGNYLSELFRHGPFVGEIQSIGQGKIVYSSRPGVPTKDPQKYHRLDCDIEMHYDSASDRLIIDLIRVMKNAEGPETTEIRPGDSRFLLAQRIAGSNLANLTTAVAHLGVCHLKVGQLLADSLKVIPDVHPIRAFLSAFAYRTDKINSQVGLLIGDDHSQIPAGKAYSSNVLKSLLNHLQDTFNIRRADPRTHAVDQGFMVEKMEGTKVIYERSTVLDPTTLNQVVMPYETLDQSVQIFEIFLDGAEKAVQALNTDLIEQLRPWYDWISKAVLGVREYGEFSRATIAKLMAIFMFNGSAQHELKGKMTWVATSFLPCFPTTINRNNEGGLPDLEELFGADYVAIATQGDLLYLKDVLENGPATFKSFPNEMRAALIAAYEHLLCRFVAYDHKLLSRKSGPSPFDLKFSHLHSSIGI